MANDDYQTSILIELQRLAGALECLCEHFGASPKDPPKPNPKRVRGKGGAR